MDLLEELLPALPLASDLGNRLSCSAVVADHEVRLPFNRFGQHALEFRISNLESPLPCSLYHAHDPIRWIKVAL